MKGWADRGEIMPLLETFFYDLSNNNYSIRKYNYSKTVCERTILQLKKDRSKVKSIL